MSETPEELVAALAMQPWRPQSLIAPRKDSIRLRWRVAILLSLIAAHALGIRWLQSLRTGDDSPDEQVVMLLDFTEPPPAVIAPEAKASKDEPEAADERPKRTAASVSPAAGPSARLPAQPIEVRNPPKPSRQAQPTELQLYDPDGSLRVPDDMLDQIDSKFGDKRVFSYQIPRMDDARKVFYRNPPVVYETTRFAQYWKPDQDLLTELLTKMVEATTKEIRIPVPGQPGSTMICKVSILAFGGGCGVLVSGADYVGPVDDPETLNPDEDRQCKAWWDQIVGATTQELWRRTRSLYEAQCRKPLERRK